jgi:glycosyltransferase involved in cell wall biosynthesis
MSRHYLTAALEDEQNPFDAFLYHLEDHRRTAFSRMHLGLKPGLVWFHDFLLTDDGPEPILNSPWSSVVARYQDINTPWPERGEEFVRERPFAQREIGVGGIPILSGEKDLSEYRRRDFLTLFSKDGIVPDGASQISGKPGFFIPYPVAARVFAAPLVSKRADAVAPLVIGVCGAPRLESRFPVLLEALSQASQGGLNFELRWLLPTEAARARARALVHEVSLEDKVTLLVGDSFSDWISLVPQLDISLHLHFSVFGQPGPALAISMAAGVPVLVTDFASSDYLSPHAVWKIQPGVSEVLEIKSAVMKIASLRGTQELIRHRERVRSVARERFDARSIANEVMKALSMSRGVLSAMRTRWSGLEVAAREALLREIAGHRSDNSSVSWLEQAELELLSRTFTEFGWTTRNAT